MAYDRLQELQTRLADLLLKQRDEENSSIKSERYLDDLRVSIHSCQAQIKQLTFARGNPLVMVNGAQV